MVALIAAHPEGPTSVAVTFADGSSGTVNVASALEGPIFAPLRNPARFAEGRFDPELRTIVWPNGADLAPEFLHELLSAQAPPTR